MAYKKSSSKRTTKKPLSKAEFSRLKPSSKKALTRALKSKTSRKRRY